MKTNLFKRSLKFFIGQRKLVVGCLIFSIVCAIMPLVLPVLEGYMLGNAFNLTRMVALAGWLFGVGVALEVSLFFLDFFVTLLSGKVEIKIKQDVLLSLSKIKITSLNNANTGTFTTRLNNDSEQLASGYATIFSRSAEIFSNAAFLIFILIASPYLGLYTLLGMVLLFFVEWLRISLWKKGKIKILDQTERANSLTNEIIIGAREIKSLGNHDYALKKTNAELDKLRVIKFEEAQKQNGLSRCSSILSLFLSFGFVLLAVMLIRDKKVAVSTFFVVYIYRMHAKGFLSNLVQFKGKLEEVKLASLRIIEIVEGNRKFLHQEFGSVQIVSTQGQLEAKNISFFYHYKKPLIKKLNLICKSCTSTAIIGKSGSGKTTLLMLLAGEISPNTGEILIDDKLLKDLSQSSKNRLLTYVDASPFFFSGSIRENLLRANPKATFSQIVEACSIAGIHNEITLKSAGYDTQVKDQTLSSGEQKRLALARAILKNSKVLILDEPTQNLDEENSKAVIDAIKRLAKTKTIILATHDLKLASVCTNVLELKSGKLIKAALT